jgi:hypothetical protein
MSSAGIRSSTASLPAGALVAARYAQHRGDARAPKPTAASVSATHDNPRELAAAIAAAFAQLGLSATPVASRAAPAVITGERTGAGAAWLASPAPVAQRQLQQYRDVAARFSQLAQALDAGAARASSTANGPGQLAAVFQGMWSSLAATTEAAGEAAGDSMPSLPSFLQTLAQNLGESGISGLRGVFVDDVA